MDKGVQRHHHRAMSSEPESPEEQIQDSTEGVDEDVELGDVVGGLTIVPIVDTSTSTSQFACAVTCG